MGAILSAIGSGLLSLLGIIGKGFAALAKWAAADLRNAAILALAVLLAIAGWTAHVRGASAAKWQATSGKFQAAANTAIDAAWKWKAARDQLADDVVNAQRDAAAADKANVARVAAQGARINERTKHDYQARLDDTDAARRQLQQRLDRIAATAPSAQQDHGDGGATPVPAALSARCQAFGAPSCDALLAALPGELTAAEQNTDQLIELQDYVRATLAIDFNGDPREAGK